MSADDNKQQKLLLDHMVAKLTKLGQRAYPVREELGKYRGSHFDADADAGVDHQIGQPRGTGSHAPQTVQVFAESPKTAPP